MNVLAFGAHPDDIEVLAGGTLSKLSSKGHRVVAVILTESSGMRIQEAVEGARILGVELKFANLPRDFFPNHSTIKEIDSFIEYYSPDLIFTHHPSDSHQAHRAAAEITFASCRRNRSSLVLYQRAFPGGITEGVFRPQLFVDISSTIKLKIAAIRAHKSQSSKDWILNALGEARHWGCMIGCKFAEAFEIVKAINIF